MSPALIDTAAHEFLITDTLSKIKKKFRPLLSLRYSWFIHRILPKDTVLLEWNNRLRLELEVDISQWFSSWEKLEQMLWYELAFIRDELDPNFNYSLDYIKINYGADNPRHRYLPLIKIVWGVTICGRLTHRGIPVCSPELVKKQFMDTFGPYPQVEEYFSILFYKTDNLTFSELEKITQKINRYRTNIII